MEKQYCRWQLQASTGLCGSFAVFTSHWNDDQLELYLTTLKLLPKQVLGLICARGTKIRSVTISERSSSLHHSSKAVFVLLQFVHDSGTDNCSHLHTSSEFCCAQARLRCSDLMICGGRHGSSLHATAKFGKQPPMGFQWALGSCGGRFRKFLPVGHDLQGRRYRLSLRVGAYLYCLLTFLRNSARQALPSSPASCTVNALDFQTREVPHLSTSRGDCDAAPG